MSEQTQNQNQEVVTTPDALYAKMVPIALARLSGPGVSEATAKELAHGLASECVAECGRLGLFERREEAPANGHRIAASLAAQPEVIGNAAPVVMGSPSVPVFAPQGPVPGSGAQAMTPIGTPHQPAQHYNHMSQPASGAGQPTTSLFTAPVMQSAPQAPPPAPARVAPQPDVVQSDVRWYPPHLKHLYEPSPPPQPSSVLQAPVATPVGIPQPTQMVPGAGEMAEQPSVGGQRIVTATGDGYMPPAPTGVMNTVMHIPTPNGHSALGLNGVISQPEQKPNQYEQVVAPQGQRVITPVGAGGSMYVPERIVK